MILKCHSSEKLVALNTLHEVVLTWYKFHTEAMWNKCLAQGHNILMPGFEPSTSVSRNRHSNHMANMLCNWCVIEYESIMVDKDLMYMEKNTERTWLFILTLAYFLTDSKFTALFLSQCLEYCKFKIGFSRVILLK